MECKADVGLGDWVQASWNQGICKQDNGNARCYQGWYYNETQFREQNINTVKENKQSHIF